MDNQSSNYKTRKVTVSQGKKESTLAKMKADGWELIEQLDGTSRSMLTFQKPVKSHTMLLAVLSAVGVIALVAGIALFALSQRPAETTAGTSTETSAAAPASSPDSPDYLSPSAESADQSPTASVIDEDFEEDTVAMTVKNSPEFAKILAGPEYCSGAIDDFAKTYVGEIIEFDGHVSTIRPNAIRKDALDTLIRSGNYGYKKGPVFKFEEDSSELDSGIGLDDPTIPVEEGQSLHIVAKIKSYDLNNCLFYLEPIETTLR